MLPKSYLISNLSTISSDRSFVDLRNQYSILNRLKHRDILSNFSFQLEYKLPKINKRLKSIQNKQNQLQTRQKRLSDHSQYLKYLQNEMGVMKKHLLQSQMNRSHSSRCNHLPQIIPIPFPSLMPNTCGQQCQKCQNCNPSTDNSNKNQHSNKNNNPPKNRRNLLKKFRKYAYAVYFCIFLKYYSVKFTKNRYQLFKQKFLSNFGERVKDQSYKITKTLQTIDLIDLIIKSPQQLKNFSTLDLQQAKKQTRKKDSDLIPGKKQAQFKKSLNFTNFYLQQLQKILLNQKFVDGFAEVISIGTLNQSFFMDDLIIPQQVQIITFSQKKGFAKIVPLTQKILVMIYIFIKHILFKILFKLRQKKYLQKMFKKQQYQKYEGQKDQMYDFLQFTSSLLYSLINDLYLQYTQQQKPKTNYQKLKKRFKIQPAKILSTPNCPKNLKQTINYKQLIVGVEKLQQLNGYLQNEKYQDQLGFLVIQIQTLVQKFYFKIKTINNMIYNKIKKATLNQKYLIFEGIKIEENQKIKSMANLSKNNSFSQLKATNNNVKNNVRFSNTSLGNMAKSKKY